MSVPSSPTTFYDLYAFSLVLGHTLRLPVQIESRSSSMLLLSWLGNSLQTNDSHTVTLYRTDPTSYAIIGMDSTRLASYQLIALDSCSPYVACVEIAGSVSFTCLTALTGTYWCWFRGHPERASSHKWHIFKKKHIYLKLFCWTEPF